MSTFRETIRSIFVGGSCAVLFIAFLFGMRHLNTLEGHGQDFASWQLRSTIVAVKG